MTPRSAATRGRRARSLRIALCSALLGLLCLHGGSLATAEEIPAALPAYSTPSATAEASPMGGSNPGATAPGQAQSPGSWMMQAGTMAVLALIALGLAVSWQRRQRQG